MGVRVRGAPAGHAARARRHRLLAGGGAALAALLLAACAAPAWGAALLPPGARPVAAGRRHISNATATATKHGAGQSPAAAPPAAVFNASAGWPPARRAGSRAAAYDDGRQAGTAAAGEHDALADKQAEAAGKGGRRLSPSPVDAPAAGDDVRVTGWIVRSGLLGPSHDEINAIAPNVVGGCEVEREGF